MFSHISVPIFLLHSPSHVNSLISHSSSYFMQPISDVLEVPGGPWIFQKFLGSPEFLGVSRGPWGPLRSLGSPEVFGVLGVPEVFGVPGGPWSPRRSFRSSEVLEVLGPPEAFRELGRFLGSSEVFGVLRGSLISSGPL